MAVVVVVGVVVEVVVGVVAVVRAVVVRLVVVSVSPVSVELRKRGQITLQDNDDHAQNFRSSDAEWV